MGSAVDPRPGVTIGTRIGIKALRAGTQLPALLQEYLTLAAECRRWRSVRRPPVSPGVGISCTDTLVRGLAVQLQYNSR